MPSSVRQAASSPLLPSAQDRLERIGGGWAWAAAAAGTRPSSEDMHRPDGYLPLRRFPPPPPPYPIPPRPLLYGTLPCHMPSCTGPVKRTGGVSGTYAIRGSFVHHTGPVFVFRSSRRRRRRHRAASGMVRQLSVTPGCTYSVCDLPIAWGYKGDTPGKGKGGEGNREKRAVTFSVARPLPPPPPSKCQIYGGEGKNTQLRELSLRGQPQGTVNHAKTATPRHARLELDDWHCPPEREKRGRGCPQLRTPYYSVQPPDACM